MTWGLLSSKIQFFNEKEENIEPSVYNFKLLMIFSNLNSASFREGSRTSVKKACGKEIRIEITEKHRIKVYFVIWLSTSYDIGLHETSNFLFCFSFNYYVFIFLVAERVTCIALAVLELPLQSMLPMNSHKPACFSLPMLRLNVCATIPDLSLFIFFWMLGSEPCAWPCVR